MCFRILSLYLTPKVDKLTFCSLWELVGTDYVREIICVFHHFLFFTSNFLTPVLTVGAVLDKIMPINTNKSFTSDVMNTFALSPLQLYNNSRHG